ncbi:MAG: hypothetical protein JWN98_1177 [Abditibacteriota bacterium]|nr:hypothetical protein [Abditibacteriota bacterium]
MRGKTTFSKAVALVLCAFFGHQSTLARAQSAASRNPPPNPRIATGAWAAMRRQHPRLFGSRSYLQALAKARPEAYGRSAKGTAERFLPAAAVVQAVEGLSPEKVEAYRVQAMQNVARGVTDLHQDTWIWLHDTALIYDAFFESLSPDERRRIIEWMNGHLEKFKTDENAFHNSTLSKILTYVRIAYATWGENPRAQEFRDYAIKKLYEDKVVPVLQEFGAGGGFTEAGWYARGSLWHLTEALELARRFENYDGFQKAPRFFYQRLAYEMFQPFPGRWLYGAERFPEEGDGSHVYGSHTEYPRLMRTVLAQYFRGSPLAAAVMNKRRAASNAEIGLTDFRIGEEAQAPLDLATFPLAHFASGIGKVFARSDWSDDATWFRFEASDYWAGHQHFDVGNFEIFKREPLATESGEYTDYSSAHAMNWLVRSIAHNVMLVHDPAEKWANMRDGGRVAYANDGGQTKKWEWTADTLDQWKAKRREFERGDIIAYQSTPKYLYVAADCSAAYAPAKLKSWIRHIVFVRPSTFVIYDQVVSTKHEFSKTWLLHCQNEPQLQGTRSTILNGKSKLSVQTLLPAGAAARKVFGYTYGGQSFDVAPNALSESAAKWRLEVTPPAANAADEFLHVLSTDDGTAPQATLIQHNGQVGAQIGDVEVLWKGNSGTLKTDGQIFPLTRELKTGVFE